jgi:hypothetical protein
MAKALQRPRDTALTPEWERIRAWKVGIIIRRVDAIGALIVPEFSARPQRDAQRRRRHTRAPSANAAGLAVHRGSALSLVPSGRPRANAAQHARCEGLMPNLQSSATGNFAPVSILRDAGER